MSIVLRYFDVRGRAEPLRLALTHSGVSFEDERVATGSNWPTLKAQRTFSGPLSQLPVLVWDDFEITETFAIARYLAERLGHYEGRSIEERARLDMVTSFVYMDVMNAATTMMWVPAGTDPRTHAKVHLTKLKRRPAQLESLLPEGKAWFGGEKPAMPDYFAAAGVRALEIILGEKATTVLAEAPRVVGLTSAIQASLGRYSPPARVTGSPAETEMMAIVRELA
jgi:glutathione S-transferase